MASQDKPDVNRDYTFLTVIGSGSFGKVWKVARKDSKDGVDTPLYACKEIHYGSMSDKEKKLLVHEVNVLKDLHHQNIVRYIDRYLDKATLKIYIVMEYCENGDLARYIKRHKTDRRYITEDKIWSVLVQLLQALNYCHHFNLFSQGASTQKVIHRDIKPGNVMLSKDGSIKLGDFGLCRTLGDLSEAKTNVGTPLYMAPEVLSKKPYTEKADIWSLGCVIYELCALQPPFVAQNMDSLKIKVAQNQRPPIPSHYSQTLRSIIDQMLSSNQSARPSSQDLLNHPKILEMNRRMASAGMAAEPAPLPQPMPRAMDNGQLGVPGQAAPVVEQLDHMAALRNIKQAPPKTEAELRLWEERLAQRERDVEAREKQVEKAWADLRRREAEMAPGVYKY